MIKRIICKECGGEIINTPYGAIKKCYCFSVRDNKNNESEICIHKLVCEWYGHNFCAGNCEYKELRK